VVFTFDDGPHDQYTVRVLDALKTHSVHAVFFLVGERLEGPGSVGRRKLVKREVNEGHLVGNHTLHHAHLCKLNEKAAGYEIDHNRELVAELSGLPVPLFRSPYGENCMRVHELLAQRAMHHTHWDIDPREWKHPNDAKRAARLVIGELRRLRGRAVVLMHDTHLATALALPDILNWLELENRRRAELGARPIRVLSGSDLVAESLEHSLLAGVGTMATSARLRICSAFLRILPSTGARAFTGVSGPANR
jgi:peptidoglycan/xylan/chitin deacetylase (PgdA/CDA1 family)